MSLLLSAFDEFSVDLFFVFKQKTAYEMRISDCSSDVCSSDLVGDRGEGASCGLQDVVTRWRELQPPPRALEEYASELLLEFVQRPRDRGLGDAQAIGGIGERAVFRKAHQITKMLQVHEVRQLPPRMEIGRAAGRERGGT